MTLYDRYLIVDWSANNTPKRGADSIWMCLVERKDGVITEVFRKNPTTRSAAMEQIYALCLKCIDDKARLFIGFDFAFGYPRGSARQMTGEDNWRKLWSVLAQRIEDMPDNKSNRFEVADYFNQMSFKGQGPFWGTPPGRKYHSLSAYKPKYELPVPEHRLVDDVAKVTSTVWQIFYTGSVGGQSLLGIPSVYRLMRDPRFTDHVAIWPFETDFQRLIDRKLITVAEIYPSLLAAEQKPDETCKDEAQVRAMAHEYAGLDGRSEFESYLTAPDGISASERAILVREEGWIVGVRKKDAAATTNQGGEAKSPVAMPSTSPTYETDPQKIYQKSFDIIESEADLGRFDAQQAEVAKRMIHACGMVEVATKIEFSKEAIAAGIKAIQAGRNVICDVSMVQRGLLAKALTHGNETLCFLDQVTPDMKQGTTKSAAAMSLAKQKYEGGVVVIGNAPTALFQLLEDIKAGGAKPALIIGVPVGFVGAVESKQALAQAETGVPFITLHGRIGGSAIASAAFNALGLMAAGAARDWTE
jgi:precorrin-8X/cobalt-precorrin-8 methylmutase